VTVHFTEDNQRWSHDFEVNEDVALRELKVPRATPRQEIWKKCGNYCPEKKRDYPGLNGY
jgi:hypothetical protein